MRRSIFLLPILVLIGGIAAFAQIGNIEPQTDVGYWVDYWSRPPANTFGPAQQAFYQNMKVILFANDDYDNALNASTLDNNVRWLNDHPNVRFYVDGYASSQGDWLYNLGLAQRRADWVKEALISRGIAADRIKISAGWGELYPTCPETNDECWSKNRLVRFIYSLD